MTQRSRTLLKAALGLTCLIGLGIYAYYGVYVKSRKETRARLEARLIFSLDKDDVTALLVERHGRLTRIERTGTDKMQFPTWAIVEPVKAPGDNISINSLLGTIERLESERVLDDTHGVDPKTYGLRPAHAKLTLKTGTEDRYTLLVGKQSSFGNLLYVQPEGEKAVYLVGGHLEGSLLKDTYDLRLKELVPVGQERVTRLVLKNREYSITLERQEGIWKLTSPMDDQADSNAVNGLLASLVSLRAQSFRDSTKVALVRYGLDPPQLELEVYTGSDQQPRRVGLGKGDLRPGRDVYYARTLEPPGPVVEIQEDHFRAFFKEPFDLRSKKLMEFEREAVFKIKSASDQELLVLEKTRGAGLPPDAGMQESLETWSLVAPRATPVDKAAVEDLLEVLGGLLASKFLGDKHKTDMSTFGLDNPIRTISLYDQAGNQLVDLRIGRTAGGKSHVYSSTRTQVCQVDPQTVERIPLEFQKVIGQRARDGGSEKP